MGHALLAISIISLSTAGCAKKTAETSASPAFDSAGAAGAGEDELAALEQQLTMREAQLRATGIDSKAAKSVGAGADAEPGRDANDSVAGTKAEGHHDTPSAPARVSEPAPMTGAADTTAPVQAEVPAGGRCEQVCEIAAAICALEQQICGLVARHQDDGRYQAACERAAGDCTYATEACHACN